MYVDILQNTLEVLFNKNQTITRIKEEFVRDMTVNQMIAKSGLNKEFCFNLLSQMALHKRANLPTLVGLLHRHFDSLQATADALYEAAVADLVNYDSSLEVFITIAEISEDVQSQIDKYQYPLPMVVEPTKLTKNTDTGYRVFKTGSVILKDNHHDEDVCLDHLNRANKVKLCINDKVGFFVRNQWKNLDKPKEGETKEEYSARLKAFNKYDTHSKEVLDLLLSEGNEFYLTHAYDKRGRVYCRGYYATYQGNAWNKACIEFANKELI